MRSRDDRRALLLLAVLLVVAAALRLHRLGEPGELVFDEVYYAQDACHYLGRDEATCGTAGEASRVHPPLGKWLIAAGIRLLGHDPVGWRAAAALAGTVTVALVALLARQLTGSLLAAGVAGLVVALDPLSVVLSRSGMLDAFVTAFGVAAVLLALGDRRTGLWRPHLLAAGLAAGAAVATKWSGAYVLAVVVALVLLRGGRSRLRTSAAAVAVWLVALPLAVYVASYAGRLDAELLALPWREGAWPRELVDRQLFMARFHAGLDETHPYASPAWSWPLGKRAVVWYFDVLPDGRYREVLAAADPLLWLPALGCAAAAGLQAVRRRAWAGPEAVVAVAVAATWLPWLVLTLGRPFVFLHYIGPAVPFLAVALGWGVVQLRGRGRSAAAAGVACTAVAVAAFWQPLLHARPLDYDSWRARIVFADCSPAEQGDDGRLRPRPSGGPPPSGWCWV